MPEIRVTPPVAVPEQVRSLTTSQLTALTSELGTCRDRDPELFFPIGTPGPRSLADRLYAEQDARTLCAGCPVQAECLEQALRMGAMDGIWGGTREWERVEIVIARAAQRRPLSRGDDGQAGSLAVAA